MARKSKGWIGDSYRHSLSARGIKNKSLDDRYELHKNRRYQELHDREKGIERETTEQKEYFYNDEDSLCVYDPFEYLEQRYGVPLSESKQLTFMYYPDDRGRSGVPKSQLDAFGKAFTENQARRY